MGAMTVPVARVNASAARWGGVPDPGFTYCSSPGLCFAIATSSDTVFAGKDGFTTRNMFARLKDTTGTKVAQGYVFEVCKEVRANQKRNFREQKSVAIGNSTGK